MQVPCGRCIGCRIDKGRAWAMRCAHEAKMHPNNCFVTLTYDDRHLPEDGSVSVRELQLFIKKLRKSLPYKIRFFACGEYGGLTFRPHYHLLIFNHQFPNLKLYKKHPNPIFTSTSLTKLWPYGNSTTSATVNYKTAAYCTQYTIKKINGDRAAAHYLRPHPVTGILNQVTPEFVTMSRRPGIGSTWFDKFKDDCFPSDFLIVDGHRVAVPRYYTDIYKTEEEAKLEQIKRLRKIASNKNRANNTRERLAVREECAEAQVTRKKTSSLGD